jgi:hypothetical protein
MVDGFYTGTNGGDCPRCFSSTLQISGLAELNAFILNLTTLIAAIGHLVPVFA